MFNMFFRTAALAIGFSNASDTFAIVFEVSFSVSGRFAGTNAGVTKLTIDRLC